MTRNLLPNRPTCPRCGKTFRRSGSGLAWHLANRPDCAAVNHKVGAAALPPARRSSDGGRSASEAPPSGRAARRRSGSEAAA